MDFRCRTLVQCLDEQGFDEAYDASSRTKNIDLADVENYRHTMLSEPDPWDGMFRRRSVHARDAITAWHRCAGTTTASVDYTVIHHAIQAAVEAGNSNRSSGGDSGRSGPRRSRTMSTTDRNPARDPERTRLAWRRATPAMAGATALALRLPAAPCATDVGERVDGRGAAGGLPRCGPAGSGRWTSQPRTERRRAWQLPPHPAWQRSPPAKSWPCSDAQPSQAVVRDSLPSRVATVRIGRRVGGILDGLSEAALNVTAQVTGVLLGGRMCGPPPRLSGSME